MIIVDDFGISGGKCDAVFLRLVSTNIGGQEMRISAGFLLRSHCEEVSSRELIYIYELTEMNM